MDPVTTIVLCLVFILLIAVINAAVAAGRSDDRKSNPDSDAEASTAPVQAGSPNPTKAKPAQSFAEPALSHPLMPMSADVWMDPVRQDAGTAPIQNVETHRTGRVGVVTFVQYTEFMVIRRRR